MIAVMAKFSDRLTPLVEPKRVTVYGNPSDELRKMLSSMGAVFVKPIAGFAR
jgi:hypothetical protein